MSYCELGIGSVGGWVGRTERSSDEDGGFWVES